jgi:hypothetical protein
MQERDICLFQSPVIYFFKIHVYDFAKKVAVYMSKATDFQPKKNNIKRYLVWHNFFDFL